MNIRLKDRRFTIACADRAPARIYHLPRRAEAPARSAPLALIWSLDRKTGAPVARWTTGQDESVDVADQKRIGGWLRRLAAVSRRAA